MENKSNHSANAAVPNATAPASQQNVNMSQSAAAKIADAAPMDNPLTASVTPTMPVPSIDILKETKEKVDITRPSESIATKIPSLRPSEIPVLTSLSGQRPSLLRSEEQVDTQPPNPTIVAKSLDSGFLATDATEKMPSVQTVFPQQTIQSSAAQFKAEITLKDSAGNPPDSKADDSPQELSVRRNTNNGSTFDGFAGKMNKLRDQMSNIFPAGIMGCREKAATADNADLVHSTDTSSGSRRFLDAKEASLDCVGHIDATPRKRPSSCKPNTGRNPLTGIGLDDSDLRRGFGRRKDGNPVLGIGYITDKEESTKPSGRVPPGGHSTKLW